MPPLNPEFTFVPTPKNIEHFRSKLRCLDDSVEFRDQHKGRLDSCELAFFAHDASLYNGPKDNDAFHPSCTEFRNAVQDPQERGLIELRIRRAIFDHAALLDQLTGSTTTVISMPGAAEPGTPASEEYVKAYAYFPGSIVNEVEEADNRNTIPDLVQLVVRELGVPTLRRFKRAISKTWKGTRRNNVAVPRPLPEIRGMPDAIPYNSSRYIFYGRKMDNRAVELQRFGLEEKVGQVIDWTSDGTLSSSRLIGHERGKDAQCQ